MLTMVVESLLLSPVWDLLLVLAMVVVVVCELGEMAVMGGRE